MSVLAFALYKFFPYGGLQRDFLRIAKACQARGFGIRVYTMSWQGDKPTDWDIRTFGPKALSSQARNTRFHHWLHEDLAKDPACLLIGFNKMPGLDFYYAADGCFADKAQHKRSIFYRWSARYRHFSRSENAVFGADSPTRIFMISPTQQRLFEQHYPQSAQRFLPLPPGIAQDRKAQSNAPAIRQELRLAYAVKEHEVLLLMVGSGFKTKGVDRALRAVAALSERYALRLLVLGQDNPRPFKTLAHRLGIAHCVQFLAGRDDVPRFLQGADLLLHPAYHENTGTVLLEALVAGLPVLCTDICGYAPYIHKAHAGKVLPSPFSQARCNAELETMLNAEQRQIWRNNALQFSETADIYSLPERAADAITQAAQ